MFVDSEGPRSIHSIDSKETKLPNQESGSNRMSRILIRLGNFCPDFCSEILIFCLIPKIHVKFRISGA